MRRLERYFKNSPYKSKKVLLVDDEEDLGWIMKEIFEEAGHSLILATSAREGMEKFKKSKRLDVAIIDLILGKESGLTFAREAKAINEKVTLIMISASGDPEIKDEARRLGVSRFLDKPLRPERLLDIINREGNITKREFGNDQA